jgi:hypothetical protein
VTKLDDLLREIDGRWQVRELPRRIDLIRYALRLVSRESNAQVWAGLQDELGSSLVSSSVGRRDLDRAIEAFRNALTVWTADETLERWAAVQVDLSAALLERIGDGEDVVAFVLHREAEGNLVIDPAWCAGLALSGLSVNSPEALGLLGERLIGPVARRLRKLRIDSVILIPSGTLTLFPLHAASYRVQGRAMCLLDEFAVSYAPSAQLLRAAEKSLAIHAGGLDGLVGIADPQSISDLLPLPFARAELAGISSFFQHHRLLQGNQATREALVSGLDKAAYAHLACHGRFEPAAPLSLARRRSVLSSPDDPFLRRPLAGRCLLR